MFAWIRKCRIDDSETYHHPVMAREGQGRDGHDRCRMKVIDRASSDAAATPQVYQEEDQNRIRDQNGMRGSETGVAGSFMTIGGHAPDPANTNEWCHHTPILQDQEEVAPIAQIEIRKLLLNGSLKNNQDRHQIHTGPQKSVKDREIRAGSAIGAGAAIVGIGKMMIGRAGGSRVKVARGPIVTVTDATANASIVVGTIAIMTAGDKKASAWSEPWVKMRQMTKKSGSRVTSFIFVIMLDIRGDSVTNSSNLNSDPMADFATQITVITERIRKYVRRCT